MKKALILILCLAVIAGGSWFGIRQYEKKQEESIVVDVVPVGMMIMRADDWYGSMEMTGNICAANAQRVNVDSQKLVQTVNVKKGEHVKKGDVILEYDMTVVELDLTQKENDVALKEQQLKMAQKELAEIKTYRPAEDAPVVPDYSYYPEPEPHPHPEPEPEPIPTVSEVDAVFTPAAGSGNPGDPFIINCNTTTVVHQGFMMTLGAAHRCAELHVYDENSTFLYKWILTGEGITPQTAADWLVTDGILLDSETGTVSIDPNGTMHGQLSFSVPKNEIPEDIPDIPEETYYPEPEYYEPPVSNEPVGNDYVYSRSDLQKMINEKQKDIQNLEYDLKKAKLDLEAAKKRKSDGRVLASIDGVVKKIGNPAGAEEEEEKEEEKDPFAEPSLDDDAFAVIEGEGGIEVQFNASEMNLPQMQPGTKVEVNCYQDDVYGTATILSVDKTPVSYSVQNWGDNPNNSTYTVHAKLDDSDKYTIGRYAGVKLAEKKETSKNGSVYMPVHYTRKDGADYYVLKVDENGLLVKQYISTGQIMWGYMIEVTGGLNEKDRICFPYGKDVKEGVRTNETTEVLYPSYY